MPAASARNIETSRFLRVASALALTTFLAGCVVGPDYDRPNLLIPATWSSKASKGTERPAELSFWWTKLNDPLLNSYVERAINGNLTVAAATARVREARATLGQEGGKLLPTLSGASSINRTKSVSSTASSGGEDPFTQYQSGFDTSWELDLFGGNKRSVEAARYGLDASEEDLRNTMLVLVSDVASNYAQVRANQARLSLAQRSARSQRETARLTKAKYETGTATTAEVSRAEAQAATTEADIPTYEIAKTAAVNRLGVLLGLPPASLSQELAKAKPIPRPKFPLPVGIPADTLLARPDVRMAERQLAQNTARIGSAEAARYPAISLTGNLTTQALHISDIAQKSTIGWAVGPSLSIPLFRGGQLRAAVEVARATRDASFANYQSAVLTAMEDVENGIVSLSQQRARSAKLSTAVAAYRQADQSSRVQYETGALDYLNLLDSQRQLYVAEGALIDSQLAVSIAYIALNKALGGGWSGSIDVNKGTVRDEGNEPRVAGLRKS